MPVWRLGKSGWDRTIQGLCVVRHPQDSLVKDRFWRCKGSWTKPMLHQSAQRSALYIFFIFYPHAALLEFKQQCQKINMY